MQLVWGYLSSSSAEDVVLKLVLGRSLTTRKAKKARNAKKSAGKVLGEEEACPVWER